MKAVNKVPILLILMSVLILVPFFQIPVFAQNVQTVSCPFYGFLYGCNSSPSQGNQYGNSGIQQPITNAPPQPVSTNAINKSSTGLGVGATSGGYLSNAGVGTVQTAQSLGNSTITPAQSLGNSNSPALTNSCAWWGLFGCNNPSGIQQPITNAPPPSVSPNSNACPFYGFLYGCKAQ